MATRKSARKPKFKVGQVVWVKALDRPVQIGTVDPGRTELDGKVYYADYADNWYTEQELRPLTKREAEG